MHFACLCVDVKQALIQWQERIDFAHKLLTLLNSYSPPELRNACLGESPHPRNKSTALEINPECDLNMCVVLRCAEGAGALEPS